MKTEPQNFPKIFYFEGIQISRAWLLGLRPLEEAGVHTTPSLKKASLSKGRIRKATGLKAATPTAHVSRVTKENRRSSIGGHEWLQ